MAFIPPRDRVLEHSTSNSQTVFAVTGALDAGFNAFSASMSVGDTTIGAVVEPGVAFVTGILTYSAANQVTVTTVKESKGTFSSSGVKEVFMGLPAADALMVDGAQSLTTAQKAQAQTNIFVGAPTTQVLTSGTTYTPTSVNVKWIEVYLSGAGGGGGANGSAGQGNGGAGGDTTFNTVVAKGGSGGVASPVTGGQGSAGGAGGTGGSGTAADRIAGGDGANGATGVASTTQGMGGVGGKGNMCNGGAGRFGLGSGGGGVGGAGGGGGGETAVLILPYAASYSYAIGAAGAAGVAGTGGSAGTAGQAGRILVIEHYS